MKSYALRIVWTCTLVVSLYSCRSAPHEKTGTGIGSSPDNESVPHLIMDYAGMKETPIIAFAWVDSSFRLEECSEVRIQPVENFSSLDMPKFQERIHNMLQESLATRAKTSSGRAVIATAAITGMRGKPGFIKRFNPTYEDSPSIEMELVISESGSGRELVKLCHMERGKDTAQAVDKLVDALTLYFKKKL